MNRTFIHSPDDWLTRYISRFTVCVFTNEVGSRPYRAYSPGSPAGQGSRPLHRTPSPVEGQSPIYQGPGSDKPVDRTMHDYILTEFQSPIYQGPGLDSSQKQQPQIPITLFQSPIYQGPGLDVLP